MPADRTNFHDILALVKRYNPLYKDRGAQLLPEQVTAEAEMMLNVSNMVSTQGVFTGQQN